MVFCGVDIKSNEANLVLVDIEDDLVTHVKCATKKLKLADDKDVKSLDTMLAAIKSFAHSNKIDSFIIRSRQSSGLRPAGGVTFKIETLFQLSGIPVKFVSPQTLAKFSKSNQGGIPTGLAKYQEDAYRAGAWYVLGQ